MEQLDVDAVAQLGRADRFDELPCLPLEHDGFSIVLTPIAKKLEARGNRGRPIGVLSSEAGWVTSRYEIAAGLKQKASRYARPAYPYVIVLNCLGEMCDDEEIEEAIFGDGGLWPKRRVPQHTRVSAVLALRHLRPWTVRSVSATLFHNPDCTHPYTGPLTALRETGRDYQKDGIVPGSILGIPLGWPDG
jgi:hypothetical protein